MEAIVLQRMEDVKHEPTPMMKQYMEIKREYMDSILMYRLGDFYEMFFDDAVKVSEAIDLTLTGRDCGSGYRAAMCGVPFHKVDDYVAKLVERGYKVAICEQMENPATAAGLVKRDIIRVITPGTITDGSMLADGKNNYLASVYYAADGVGLAFADISTGLMNATFISGDGVSERVKSELSVFAPSEVLLSINHDAAPELCKYMTERFGSMITDDKRELFKPGDAMANVSDTFSDETVLHVKSNTALVCAVGALIAYTKETQKCDSCLMRELTIYIDGEYMEMDVNTCRNLELIESMRTKEKKGSLLWILDKTKTAMGTRLLRSYIVKPSVNMATIIRRHDCVEALYSDYELRENLGDILSNIRDIERLMSKVVYGTANARDLYALFSSISMLPKIKEALSSIDGTRLSELRETIDTLDDISKLLGDSINPNAPVSVREGGMIKDEYSPEVAYLRSVGRNSHDILEKLEEKEKELTGIKNLRVGYNKVFGYFIEVTNSQISMVPERYIRKQTLTNCERYITQELKSIETDVVTSADRLCVLEYEIFCRIRAEVAAQSKRIQEAASFIAEIDVYRSLASVAKSNNYVRPEMTDRSDMVIKGGRHPVVEKFVDGAYFVPNDTTLDTDKNRLMLITGPNMAGKSTYMRQVALIAVMAQMGSFVPAEYAGLPIVDKVFTRVGASDDLASGQSTFMLEMNEVAYILKKATRNSLVVYDEVGRGTSTYDGMSIARAVAEYTAKKIKAKTLFATHYHELTVLENEIDGVVNYNVVAKKKSGTIVFLRKIVRGATDDSYGIEVAKLAGVPSEVISRAGEILAEIEQNGFAPQPVVSNAEKDHDLFSMAASAEAQEISDRLRLVDINTLTPLEAMNTLYELKKMLKG